MNNIFQDSITELQYRLTTDLAKITMMKNSEPEWSEPKPLFKKKHGKKMFEPFGVIRGTIGVYRIIYKPTMETVSIGCGVITGRLGRHRSVFLNKGKDISHKSGTTSPSATAGHMYKYDTHRKNWLFSWCSIENKLLAEEYELQLQKMETPLFNDLSMAGK
jgi:hypothetical protein